MQASRARSVLPSFCCVTVELDSFAETSHSEHVTHIIRYLNRTEQEVFKNCLGCPTSRGVLMKKQEKTLNMVPKLHYNGPKPYSAL